MIHSTLPSRQQRRRNRHGARARRRRPPPPPPGPGSGRTPASRRGVSGHRGSAAERSDVRPRGPAVPRDGATAGRAGGVPERHGAAAVPAERQVRGGGVVPARGAGPRRGLPGPQPLRRRATAVGGEESRPRLPHHRGRRRARVPGGRPHPRHQGGRGRVPAPAHRPRPRPLRHGDGRRHGRPPRPAVRRVRGARQLPPRLLRVPARHRRRRHGHRPHPDGVRLQAPPGQHPGCGGRAGRGDPAAAVPARRRARPAVPGPHRRRLHAADLRLAQPDVRVWG